MNFIFPKNSMFDRFTEKARRVIDLAGEEIVRLHHNHFGTEHLLLGLLREEYGGVFSVFQSLGFNLNKIKRELEKVIVPNTEDALVLDEVPFTPEVKKALEFSLEETKAIKCNYIGTEQLLLGLIREGKSISAKILKKYGFNLKMTRQIIDRSIYKKR